MKKIISLLTIVALVAVLAIAAFAAEEPVLVVGEHTAQAGDLVTFEVVVKNNVGFSAGEMTITLDGSLEFAPVNPDEEEAKWEYAAFANGVMGALNPNTGFVTFAAMNDVTGEDALVIKFIVKVKEGTLPGEYPVSVYVDYLENLDYEGIVSAEFTGKVIIPCTDHVAGDVVIENEVPATCAATGSHDEVIYCTLCGAEMSRVTVTDPMVEHTWGEWEVTTPASCGVEGVETRTCSICGETETRAIAALEHTWGEWEVTTPASCGVEGVETRTCSVCGETETRATAALDHEWVETERVEATGCTDGKVVYTCSICGETKEEVLPASGEHTWVESDRVEATCCENGKVVYTCSVCGETKEEVLNATGEHELTYVDNGENHKIVCANSGKELGVEDHVYGDFVEDPENPGWKFQVCVKCGHQHKEEVPTGDNTMIAVAAALVSMMGIVALVAKKEF